MSSRPTVTDCGSLPAAPGSAGSVTAAATEGPARSPEESSEPGPPVRRVEAGSARDPAGRAPVRERSPTRSGYALSSVDGSPIFYTLNGREPPGETPTVVLSDGIGCDGFVWKYLQPRLAGRGPVLHWHYRGHGRTPPPRDRDRVAIADLADDLRSLLDECQIDRAVLFGHSMGVQVSLETFRRHRDRVSGLVLVCGSPGQPLKTFHGSDRLEYLLPRLRGLVRSAPWLFNRLSRAVLPTRVSYAVAKVLEINGDLLAERDFMPYLRGLSRVESTLFFDMLSAANQHSARDLLGAVDVPTLIVAGGRDGMTPPALSREMHGAIPRAELLMIDDGSHTAPLERPEATGQAIEDFLDRRIIHP